MPGRGVEPDELVPRGVGHPDLAVPEGHSEDVALVPAEPGRAGWRLVVGRPGVLHERPVPRVEVPQPGHGLLSEPDRAVGGDRHSVRGPERRREGELGDPPDGRRGRELRPEHLGAPEGVRAARAGVELLVGVDPADGGDYDEEDDGRGQQGHAKALPGFGRQTRTKALKGFLRR